MHRKIAHSPTLERSLGGVERQLGFHLPTLQYRPLIVVATRFGMAERILRLGVGVGVARTTGRHRKGGVQFMQS
jgi:hypothetical protein